MTGHLWFFWWYAVGEGVEVPPSVAKPITITGRDDTRINLTDRDDTRISVGGSDSTRSIHLTGSV